MPYYTYTPLDFEEQLELLRKNGLAFLNEQKALHTLRHISYFKMKEGCCKLPCLRCFLLVKTKKLHQNACCYENCSIFAEKSAKRL